MTRAAVIGLVVLLPALASANTRVCECTSASIHGSGSTFVNSEDAAGSDDSHASQTGIGVLSGYLDCFVTCAPAVPDDAVFGGIECQVEAHKMGAATAGIQYVHLFEAQPGDNTSDKELGTTSLNPITDAEITYGGPSDLWDAVSWTPAMWNSGNAGCAIRVMTNTGASSHVDHMSVILHYTSESEVETPTPAATSTRTTTSTRTITPTVGPTLTPTARMRCITYTPTVTPTNPPTATATPPVTHRPTVTASPTRVDYLINPSSTDAHVQGQVQVLDGGILGCVTTAAPSGLAGGDFWCVDDGGADNECYFYSDGASYAWTADLLTPTPTPTNTRTFTSTATVTNTPTATPTFTPAGRVQYDQVITNTPTRTPTDTPTSTPTRTATETPTASPTATPT